MSLRGATYFGGEIENNSHNYKLEKANQAITGNLQGLSVNDNCPFELPNDSDNFDCGTYVSFKCDKSKPVNQPIPFCDANGETSNFVVSMSEDKFYVAVPSPRGYMCNTDETQVSKTTDYRLQFSCKEDNKCGWYCTNPSESQQEKWYCVPRSAIYDGGREDLFTCQYTNDSSIATGEYTPFDSKEDCQKGCNRQCSNTEDTNVICTSLEPSYFGVDPETCRNACGFYCKDAVTQEIVQNDPTQNKNVNRADNSCVNWADKSLPNILYSNKKNVKGCFPNILKDTKGKKWDWIQGCEANYSNPSNWKNDSKYDEHNSHCGRLTDITEANKLDVIKIGDTSHRVGILPPGQGCYCEMRADGIDTASAVKYSDGNMACKHLDFLGSSEFTSAVKCANGSTAHIGTRDGRPYIFCIPD